MASSNVAFAERAQHLFENWDLNEDGAVTVEEARERRGDVFATFDADETAPSTKKNSDFSTKRASSITPIKRNREAAAAEVAPKS